MTVSAASNAFKVHCNEIDSDRSRTNVFFDKSVIHLNLPNTSAIPKHSVSVAFPLSNHFCLHVSMHREWQVQSLEMGRGGGVVRMRSHRFVREWWADLKVLIWSLFIPESARARDKYLRLRRLESVIGSMASVSCLYRMITCSLRIPCLSAAARSKGSEGRSPQRTRDMRVLTMILQSLMWLWRMAMSNTRTYVVTEAVVRRGLLTSREDA